MKEKLFDEIEEAITGEKPVPTEHVVFVMDHSGSMTLIEKESMENFNDQIDALRDETEGIKTLVTVVEFDNEVKITHLDTELEKIAPLESYWTGGTTALFDAIGIATSKFESKKEINDPTEDHSVLFIIITDGAENASKEFSDDNGRLMLKEKIERLEKKGNWTFTFLGANIDVMDTAVTGMSMNIGNTMSFAATTDGMENTKKAMTKAIGTYYTSRKLGSKSVKNFYDDDDDNKVHGGIDPEDNDW